LLEHEAELSDVMVILRDPLVIPIDQAMEQLKQSGMTVEEFDPENGAVEGTVAADKIGELGKLVFVQYVRRVFDYVAETPEGDGAGAGDDSKCGDLPDVDDAGA
jgi:hypothetical protein